METGERAEPTSAATCVVWCPMGILVPPRALIQALTSRGFQTIHCDDAFEVLARLCVCVASREPDKRAVSLVVIDRHRLGEIDDFLEALETYTPSVVPWDYDEATGLQPLAITPDDAVEPAPDLASSPASGLKSGLTSGLTSGFSRTSASPPLKISDNIDFEDEASIAHAGPHDDSNDSTDDEPTMSQLLTDEELEMLLGDDEPSAETDAGENP